MIHLAWLLVLASHAGARGEQASTTEVSEPCRFAWPVPTSVWVTQDAEKRGQAATMRYRLTLSAGAVDGELLVRLTDFEFLSVGGQDATTPEMRQALATSLTLAQAVPDMIVDQRGNYLRTGGVDEMIDRLVAHMGAQGGQSPEQMKQMLANMKSPAARATLEQACGDYWNTWVGAWVGFELSPGLEGTEEQELPFMGTVLPAKVTKHNAGPAAEHPGHVELLLTTVVEGPAATSAFADSMASFAQQAGGQPFPKDALVEMRSTSVVTVVTDEATLKPLRASRAKTIRVAMKGEGPKEQVERAEYTFDWSAGASTGAK